MFKKIVVILLVAFFIIAAGQVFAAGKAKQAEKPKAGLQSVEDDRALLASQDEIRTRPGLITADSIYITNQLKLIYNQNEQIIKLLQEISSLEQRQLTELHMK